MIPGGPEPGWYFETIGSEHERFWDGQSWTEHWRSRSSSTEPISTHTTGHQLHPKSDGTPTAPAKAVQLEKGADDGRLLTRTAPVLSLAVIEDLKNKGHSQSEIAKIFGVTRQAVSWHKKTYGGRITPREKMVSEFPWKVSSEQSQSTLLKRIRDHGEYVATGGKGMSEDKLKRLRSFYRKLRDENLVVEHDPALPPAPGVAKKGGFALRARQVQDGNLLIRVNEFTNLTDEGREIWRFPPQDP